MAIETMAANTKVERIVLQVEAPKGGLDAADSGINIAILQLEKMDRLLQKNSNHVDRLFAKLRQSVHTGQRQRFSASHRPDRIADWR